MLVSSLLALRKSTIVVNQIRMPLTDSSVSLVDDFAANSVALVSVKDSSLTRVKHKSMARLFLSS